MVKSTSPSRPSSAGHLFVVHGRIEGVLHHVAIVPTAKSAVCEQTERINDVMDEALLSRCHESPQHLLSVLMKVVGDYVDSVPAVHEVCPLYTPDEDEFIDWLKEGRAYGFVEVPGEAAE